MNLPYWTLALIPPLLLVACLLANGSFGRHPGHHQAAALRATSPARRRGRRDDIEAARMVAHVARVANHEPPPLLAAQLELVAVKTALAAWEPVPPASGPLPAAMQNDDSGRPWEYETGQWPALMAQIGGGDASTP